MTTDIDIWLTGGAILALLATSAFCSGSETALTAASRPRLHALEGEGDARAKIVNVLLSGRERLIGALLLGNTFVNTLATALATGILIERFGAVGVVYATIAMTVLVLILGAALPKTLAITFPNRTSLAVAPFVRVLVGLLSPFNGVVQVVVALLLRLLGVGTRAPVDEETAHLEIRGAIDLHHKEGAVVKADRDMIGGVLDLGELAIADIMVHRTKMQTISGDEPPQAIVDAALSSTYSRIPVWQGDADNIVGVLHLKDLLRALLANGFEAGKLDLDDIYVEPWFVPDTTMLKDQLKAFLARKAHIALVVDEYGIVMGLVTLEDIIEEIVGQIADEHEERGSLIRPQSDGRIIVDGSVPIRDVNREMEWHLPDAEATTIAGLVIHEAQTIPDSGQAFTFYGYRFEILRKSRNRITALRIAAPEPSGPETAAE